jgi:hypothetical protein
MSRTQQALEQTAASGGFATIVTVAINTTLKDSPYRDILLYAAPSITLFIAAFTNAVLRRWALKNQDKEYEAFYESLLMRFRRDLHLAKDNPKRIAAIEADMEKWRQYHNDRMYKRAAQIPVVAIEYDMLKQSTGQGN